MSEERLAHLEKQLTELVSGGANITVQDPRVSQVQNWLIGLVGAGIIISLGWLANSVDNLNRNFAAISEWRTFVDQRLDTLEKLHGR